MAHQDEIATALTARLLHRYDISWRLNNTQQPLFTLERRTDWAQVALGKHAATLALADTFIGFGNCVRQRLRALSISLQ